MSLKDLMKKKAWESTVAPHPLLAKNIDISVKEAYLGGVVMAALIDNGMIEPEEQKRLDELGVSFRLPEASVKELVESAKELHSDEEKVHYFEELIPALKERDTALFFLCDFAKTLGANGNFTEDDIDYMDAMAEWLGLSEDDLSFYNGYRVFLLPEKGAEAEELLDGLDDDFMLPENLCDWFTPETRRILLEGGELPPGETRICDGRYRLNDELHVPDGSSLFLSHADIALGVDGRIWFETSRVKIEHCKFSLAQDALNKTTSENSSAFIVAPHAEELILNDCTFDGKKERGSLSTQGNLKISNCKFTRCFSAPTSYNYTSPIIYGDGLEIKNTIFSNIVSNKEIIYSCSDSGRENIIISECIFHECHTPKSGLFSFLRSLGLWSMTSNWGEKFIVRNCLFINCSYKHFFQRYHIYSTLNIFWTLHIIIYISIVTMKNSEVFLILIAKLWKIKLKSI